MDSTDLSVERADELHAALFPHLDFLARPKNRPEELRFPQDDPLRLATAENAHKTENWN
jgi:hypothetical protein